MAGKSDGKGLVKAKSESLIWFSGRRARARVWLALLAVVLCTSSHSATATQSNAKNVLVLSGGVGHSVSIDLMESTLRAHVPWPVKFSAVADLEDPPFDKESYRGRLAEALGHGFGGEKPDLVIAVMDPSLRFALQYRDRMFPSVPIVFMSITSPKAAQARFRWPGVTGVVSAVGIRATIDLALRLHPGTNTVAVITNVSDTENDYLAAVHAEFVRRLDKVREIDLVGPANAQMLERVASLPPHTVILFQLWPHDSDSFTVYDLLARVSERLPTYCIFSGLCLNHGGIGGAYTDAASDAVMAGELAAGVMSGERADDVPLARNSDLRVTVDWRALQHWHVPESALPPGTLILNRPPSIWQEYRNYILAAIGVMAAQALLIIALLWQRKRKRRAEAVLRESEERFRVMADTTPSLIWMCDAQGKITYLNEQRLAFTGPDPHAGYGDTWIAFIHPDDVKGVLDALWQALKDQRPFSKEYRLHRSDATYRWMFDVASPRVNGDGAFAGFIGSAIDVTDQKLAQEALQNVSGQLIEAQEKERARIARDLHDDICQRLALLSMELQQAQRVPHGSVSATKKSLEEIRKHCSEIASDVQSLSHELHSSKLDYLGVVAAVRGFCREFSKQHGVTVDFADRGVPPHLTKDISLCLFRVAQEALHNAVKYSGTSQFKVELSATEDRVQLSVSDAGAGFDVEEARKNRGLGLVSMHERVNLVHGKFTVESKPGAGTRIRAVLPLITENGPFLGGGEVIEATGSVQAKC